MSKSPLRFLALVVALATVAATSGCGITAPTRNEGYADFDASRYRGLRRDASISLGPRVINFAARHTQDDPEARAILRAVDGVRVKVYQLGDRTDSRELAETLSATASELAADQWQAVARVNEDDETVLVLVKEKGESLVGVCVLAADEQELVFVNVMGRLTPELLARVSPELPAGNLLSRASDHVD